MLMDVFFLGPDVPHVAEAAAYMAAFVQVQPVVE